MNHWESTYFTLKLADKVLNVLLMTVQFLMNLRVSADHTAATPAHLILGFLQRQRTVDREEVITFLLELFTC